nr:protein yippee-like At4g27745 [Solanum lycopersicum]
MDKSVGLRGYCCFNCRNIGIHEKGRGRAFLFSHAINVVEEPPYYIIMITGPHVVSDILCAECGKNLGWKYQRSFREVNKYKEGKIVLVKLSPAIMQEAELWLEKALQQQFLAHLSGDADIV